MKILSLTEIFEFYSNFYADTYQAFRSAYVDAISRNCDLTKPQTTSVAVLRKAIGTALTQVAVPPPVKYLFDKYCASSSTLIQFNKTTKAQKKPHSESQPASVEKRSILISNTRSKKVKRHLEGLDIPYPSVCKIAKCSICDTLKRETPLSACNHPNAHPHEYFPHVKRDTLLQLHLTKDVVTHLESATGISNPAAKAPVQDDRPPSPVVQVMDVESVPVPDKVPDPVIQPSQSDKAVKAKKAKKARRPTVCYEPKDDEEYTKFFQQLFAICGERNKAFAFMDGLGFKFNVTMHRILDEVCGPAKAT